MDFQRIVEDEKIRMNVPIHLVGEDVGARRQTRRRFHFASDDGRGSELSCRKICPSSSKIDVSAMGLNEMLHLTDIKVPDGVEIVALAQGEDQDQPIVSIHVIKEVVEAEPEAAESEEGAAAEADAEAPAEGCRRCGRRRQGHRLGRSPRRTAGNRTGLGVDGSPRRFCCRRSGMSDTLSVIAGLG